MRLLATPENRYHLSCKTLIIKDDKALMVYASDYTFANGKKLGEFYSLVRETMEEGESPEETLVRGAAEELGVTISPIKFIGSSEFFFENGVGSRDYPWHKTSIYFVSDYIDDDQSDRIKGADTQHEKIWVNLGDVPKYLRKSDAFGGELTLDADIIERWLNTLA